MNTTIQCNQTGSINATEEAVMERASLRRAVLHLHVATPTSRLDKTSDVPKHLPPPLPCGPAYQPCTSTSLSMRLWYFDDPK